jgi:hypothetical protein
VSLTRNLDTMHETLRRTRLDYFSANTVSVTLGYVVCIIVVLHSWPLTLLFFTQWCWRRMEMIRWTDHVRNEEVLRRVKEQRNILHEISKRKASWIGHISYKLPSTTGY